MNCATCTCVYEPEQQGSGQDEMYLLYGRGFSRVPFEDELGLCSLHLFLWNIVTKSVSWTAEKRGGEEVIIHVHVHICLEFMHVVA